MAGWASRDSWPRRACSGSGGPPLGVGLPAHPPSPDRAQSSELTCSGSAARKRCHRSAGGL
eukprot:6074393-Lingulodinium_polyedra.AAC.1